jgi:hypothetical protein
MINESATTATVQIAGYYPANDLTSLQYSATCEACEYKGIPSLFHFYAEADARDHNTDHHSAARRRPSLLADRVQA